MEIAWNEILMTLLPQLGFASVFMYLYHKEKEENKENIKTRDNRIQQMTDNLMEAYRKNGEICESLQNAVDNNTRAIERNTASVQSLSEKIHTTITSRNGS
ncbi:MAG TPA: hypothetical protein VD999_05840 [Vitreimonas sp.]|nr:hypothetical protein [Vitreimonas sp.]